MIEDKCEAAIVALNIYRKLDPNSVNTKIIYLSRPTAGQAITVSPNFSYRDFNKYARPRWINSAAALKNLQSRFASPPPDCGHTI